MDSTVRMLNRIYESQDGRDFVDYLKQLSKDNYEAFKKDSAVHNDVHKGYGIAIDSLIIALETSKAKEEPKKVEAADWM